ncbi:MAG: carboxylate-amine ligase, partial [Halocynthiibacter sp.]
TLSLAALTQCLTRMLWRLARSNQRWRMYDNFLIAENRWRAQRYGVSDGLIDFGAGQIVAFETLLEEIIDLVAEDAEHVGALQDIENAREFVTNGTASDRQRRVYNAAITAGKSKDDALKDVVTWLTEAFHDGL